MTICAIHQPNFIPWLPYFDKIAQSDLFIFIDQVAYPKSGKSMGSWCNRVKIDMHGHDIWFSCPLVRESGVQVIDTVKINYDNFNFSKWMYTLECAYNRYANFNIIKKIIVDAYEKKYNLFADFNIHLIKKICCLLKINTVFVRQSEISVSSSSNQMLVDLCKKVNATKYLSGLGAIDYMDNSLFAKNNIEVIYQNQIYKHSINQLKKYSIIHYLITTNMENWENFNATF